MHTLSDVSTKFDLNTRQAIANPFPLYAEILREAPIHWNQSLGGWFVGSYDALTHAFRDPRLSANRLEPVYELMPPEAQAFLAPLFDTVRLWKAMQDPPLHTRMRLRTSETFSRAAMERLRPKVQLIADELLDELMERGQMDLVNDFGNRFPTIIICELIGVPVPDRSLFHVWCNNVVHFFSSAAPSPELSSATRDSIIAMDAYLQEVILDRRRNPRHDLISHLLEVRNESGHAMSEEEIRAECILLLVAGQEAPPALITNATILLFQNPDLMRAFRAQPTLVESALEELLRHQGPTQRESRMAIDDFELEGHPIKKGDLVWLVMGAANRDPEHFPDPDRFDIHRPNSNRHVAFGYGAHYCEGASLARVEVAVGLETILRRLPKMQPAIPLEEVDWGHEPRLTRSPHAFPITF